MLFFLFHFNPTVRTNVILYTYLQVGCTIGNISHVVIYLCTQPMYHLVSHTPTYGQGRRWNVDLTWVKTLSSLIPIVLSVLRCSCKRRTELEWDNLSLASPAWIRFGFFFLSLGRIKRALGGKKFFFEIVSQCLGQGHWDEWWVKPTHTEEFTLETLSDKKETRWWLTYDHFTLFSALLYL